MDSVCGLLRLFLTTKYWKELVGSCDLGFYKLFSSWRAIVLGIKDFKWGFL